MNTNRALLALAILSLFCVAVTDAYAQTTSDPRVELTSQLMTRVQPLRDDSKLPYWVNYADCIADDILTFTVLLSNFEGNLEVWAASGVDCTTYEKRHGASAECWLVYQDEPTKTTWTVDIRAQALVAAKIPGFLFSGVYPATVKDCEHQGTASGVDVTLFFMLVDGTGRQIGTGAIFDDTGFDVRGPPAPEVTDISSGEEKLFVKWDPPSTADLVGYKIYCDPPDDKTTQTTQALDAGLSTGGTGGTAAGGTGGTSTGGSTGTGGSTATGGSAATTDGGATDSGTVATSMPNPDCPSTIIIPGERPGPEIDACGRSGAIASSGIADGLVNGQVYTVAVAGTDQVDNSGPLSNSLCSTPAPVTDFFEHYRAAGGGGGGGLFCSIGHARAPSVAAAGALMGALCLILRRRFRRRK